MANINAQFNYSANFGPVIGQMQKLTAEANLLNNTLQNLDKQAVGLKTSLASSFASDLGKIGGYNAKMIELTDSVDQFGQSLLKQKLTLKEYAQEAIGAFSKSSNAHKLAVREVAREMSQLVTLGKGMDGKQMGMMITPATINLKDFNTQLAVSQKQWSIFNSLVQDGTTHLINFGKNTQWAGRQITVGLTVPLTIYGNAVSKIFREVDAELTRFQKVYGSDLMNSTSESTNSMVNDVRNLAIEFSKSFGIAAKETASLAADLAATGLEGQKLLASLRETTRLAVLGDVSNQDAMKTTLSLQNAFKISTDELASSVNFLNAVENQTSLSLQDLTTAIPKAGPVVKALGGDVKDLSLLMVALKEGGISAAEGANALKSGMASLINPTKQASITAKQYGIDINGIVQANRGQLMPTIIAFQQQLQLLDDFGKAQVIENVFGKYQFARISALFDNLNASASQTNAVLGLMGKSNKELAATAYQEMDTLMNSSSKRFQRAIEGIKAQFISIGGSITASITPILENLMGKIGKAIEFFQNLPKPVKSFIKVATGLTAIAGPIIMMVGIFSNFLGYIGKGAMGMVNLGRRMAGLPTQKFEMLTDTQIMATKATEQLSMSFDRERSSVERLNQALGIYRQNLVDAISLNPAFVNRQMPSVSSTPPTAKLQRGGSPFVPGSGSGDKVPAMLEPGEYVVNKKAAAKYSSTLDQINFQSAPRFQNGGRMPGYADTSTSFNYSASYPVEGFKFDQSKHLVLANGKVMQKSEYDRISSQGGRLPVLMRDDMNPYLNEKYQSSLRYNLGGENPFVGPLPQVSYQAMGRAGVGGSRNIYGYPFNSEQEAAAFSALNSTTFGGNSAGSQTSNILRSINDPQQKAYADWISGHNSNQFRANTGVMKRLDMEGHRQQMLNSMGPISENIPLFRGTVLREKGANEFSGVGARELLMYIKNGMFEKAMGKKIQWSDMQSFSTIPNISNYNKFIESWTNPSNTNSKKAVNRQLESMAMLPVIFRLASAQGQTGFNISSKAMVQEVMGKPVDEKEWVLNNPSGTITGIRQDMGTKHYIIDLMQKGGRVQSHQDESLMPEKYSKKMEGIQSVMDATAQEATAGMYAGMPMTDVGNLVDRIGGRSAAIPGASGIYEQGGVRSVVKGHNTATSARIEAIASALTRSVFGLESPVQEFIKFAHPETSSPMFGVRSPFDAKFAKTSGKIGAGDFFMQALSAIIRGDSDLQPDNLYDGIVVDQGAGYGSDRASQPRGLTGKKFSVQDQAKVNFLMQKGGARRWFTEATAGIAQGMTREQYIAGFMQAISTAQANFPAAMASLAGMNLTKEEQQIFGVLAGDLQAAQGIDWGSVYDSHVGVTPEVKKPPTEAAAAKALLTKQANKEEYEKATAAGYPSWMGYALGGRVNGYQDVSTMFYGTGHGIKKASAPKDWKKAIFAGLDSPLVKKRSSNASGMGLANSSRIEIAHTKSDVYKKVLGYNAKQWDGSEIFEVGLINNLLNMLDGTGTVGKFAQKWMGNAVNVQPDSKTEGTRLFNALGKAIPHLGDKDAPKGNSRNWILKAHEFLSNPENIDYYSQKVKINDFIRGSVSPLQTLSEDVPKNIKEKIKGMQSGGRLNGYATETTSWAKKAAAPKAYAGVLQGIPNWATKANEYNAIVSALQNAGVPQSDRLASFYIQDVLAHINPSTTNANGIYEKVWAAANLMKDSQVYNVFLETLRTRKDIGGLLNPSTVSRVASASGLPMPVVQAELTKIADGVHPNTANGAKVMMTLARMFPSRTSPGMPIAVAAGMQARLQGNFYDTLGQRALPSSLPNITVRAYDPKGGGAPTSTGQGSRVRSTGLIMPSGAIRPSMVMPNIQSISSAAGGMGTSATVKVDGMGNVLSNGIDDMVANTITGQPIAVSSKELLAVSGGGLIAGVTSPGDEARGKIIHPMGTSLMRGGKFQRLRGFAEETVVFGPQENPNAPRIQTEAVFEGQAAYGRMDKFASSVAFLTSGVYTLQTAFQQFTATTQDGADKFTKMAAAATLGITGLQGVSQMLVDNGKVQAMQDKAAMMQAPGRGGMSSGMGKLLGAGSKVLGVVGGPMGMLATSVLIGAVNKGIDMYQKAVKKAKDAGRAMFAEPIEGAKLLGITLKDTTEQAKTYAKIAKDLGMSSAGKGGYDKVYADVVKKDFGPLIDSLKLVLNAEEKRNKLALTYVSLQQQGFSPKDAREYTQEIARQSGAMTAFNQLNLESLKTSKDIANQVVSSTRAIIASVGTVDSSLLGKYINKETGTIYDTESQANASDTSIGDRNVQQITTDTAKTLSAGMLGNLDLNLTEKQLGEAIGGAFKLAYQIAANDPAAANAATALLIGDLKNGSDDLKNAANEAISQAFLDAGGSKGDLAYSFLAGGGLTDIASKFGNEAATAIQMAVQSGNVDIVNTLLSKDISAATIDKFKSDFAKLQTLAKIDLEVDIQLNQTKVQLEEMKTEIGKVFDIAIAAKEKETEAETKRHEQALKNLDRESQRINDKKKALQENTDYYLKQLERESKAEDFYANQRQTALTGLKAASEGDIFGLIGAQMQAATQGDQFGRDRALETINDTSDLAQKKLDNELANIDARKASESERHEQELANIKLEIEFLNKKRATSIGLINKAMEAVDKAKALGPSDPGYQKAQEDATALAIRAGIGAEQVNSYFNTLDARSEMSKEDLAALDKAQTELKDKVSAFQEDAVTAISVFEKANEIATKVFESFDIDTTTLEGLKTFQEIIDAMNTAPPVTPPTGGGATDLPGVNTGTGRGAITGANSGAGVTPSMVNDPNVRFKPATSMTGVVVPGTTYQKDPDNPKIAWFWDGKAGKWGSSVPTSTLPNVLFGYQTAKKKAMGGMLSGPGTGTSDSIPIMASNGEYIFRADVVKRIGKAKLDQINSGNFAYGGMVGSMPGMSSAPGMATGGFVGSMPSYSSAPGMAAGGFIGNSAPSIPTYNVPSAGGGMSPSPIAQMARGGQINSSSSSVNSSPVMNFNGAGMDMVMHHINKAIGGRINSNSRRIG